MWRSYSVAEYGFSFLYPRDWQVKALDANHIQVLYKDTALTIGYRFTDQKISLAPSIIQKNLILQDGFSFLGEDLTIYTRTQDDTASGGQNAYKAFYFDGGGELIRGNLAFSLRLENIDKSQTLASIGGDEFQEFYYIVASIMRQPDYGTRQIGAKANLSRLGLDQTQSIEIGLFNPAISNRRYLYQHLINDPALIARLVKTLDADLPLQPATDCIEAYELTFHLWDNRSITFGYECSGQPAALTRGIANDGSLALDGNIPVTADFVEMLQGQIYKAETLRDNNAPPLWKSRIVEKDSQAGPFTLEEYQILDPGRWAPYSLEFKVIIPESVFTRRAGLRKGEGLGWPIPPIKLNGHTITVDETWDKTVPQNYASVQQDDKEIYRIATRGPAGTSPIKGLWAWDGKWVLEVDSHIVIDGKELDATLGGQESFDWQIMQGKPFAFVIKDGQVNAWYAGSLYPLGYDKVVHNRCCEAGMFNPGHNAQMVWFYAHKAGYWRYVEMGLYQ